MKKILFDARLLIKGGASGIEGYTRSLLHTLLSIDKEHKYELFYNGFRKVPLTEFLERGALVHDWRIPSKFFDASSKFLNWPKVDEVIETDLVFSPHFNILKLAHAPRVMTFHDLSFIHHPDFYSFRKNFWHWLQSCKEQAQEASKIIAMSDYTAADIAATFAIPHEKIVRVYSGINPMFHEISSDGEQFRMFIQERNLRKPFLLYLGTVEPRKNVPAVIRAFNLLKTLPELGEHELIIAGAYGWLYKETLREAGHSPYRGDIRFLGQVTDEERVFLYNLASVFVYPSFFEGFGFPPLEAQACGTPVVASNRTSLPEILGDSALLVDPWRVRDLADAIQTVLTKSRTQTSLRRRGLKNAARYTWKRSAAETIHVFKQFL